MTIQYPRTPTGPTPSGAAGVRALQTAGGDWQTKKMANGVTSRNQGPFQKATVELDGWVSAGKVSRTELTALQYITPSWRLAGGVDDVVNRRGSNEFTNLDLGSSQPRAIPENPIAYLADGRIYKLEHIGEFLLGSTTTANLQLKSSYIPYGSGRLVSGVVANTLPEYIPGSRHEDKWYGGLSHDMLTTTDSMGYYTGFEVGGDAWRVELPAIPTGPLIPKTRRPAIHRLSSSELFGFIPGIESVVSGPRGSQFCYTSDNGRTWFYAYSSATIITDRVGYNPLDPYAWDSDASVFQVLGRFMATRMPDGTAIAVVGEGAYSADQNRLRIYGLASTTTILFASNIEIGPSGTYSTVYTQGGHHYGRPFIQLVNETSSVHYLSFVRTALNGMDSFPLPQPSHWTGRVRSFDEETLQCPMYFQETEEDKPGYYICLSTDFGATWEKHRLIKEDDIAPAELSFSGDKVNHVLQAYADAFLPKRFNVPTNTYPGSSWIGDDRITPPWLE